MYTYDDATAGVFLDPAEVLAAFSVAHGFNEDQYTFSVSHTKADSTHVKGRYCRYVNITANSKVRVFDINKGAYRIIDPGRVTDLKRMKVKSVPVTEEEASQYIPA